jgi:hypothetical protein
VTMVPFHRKGKCAYMCSPRRASVALTCPRTLSGAERPTL